MPFSFNSGYDTDNVQNVAGTSSNVGFFFTGFTHGILTNVQVGWYAQGPDVQNGLVIAINPTAETITISGSQPFTSGQSYAFSSTYVFFLSVNPPCFNEGTKILCLNKDFQEEYVPIENLREGNLVKTYLEGYRKIHIIGRGTFINNPERWQSCMYTLPKCNNMIDDLTLTGLHSIVVDKDELAVDDETLPIHDKFLICAGKSARFQKRLDKNECTFYHFCLENDGYPNRLFAVWANGILAETTYADQFIGNSLSKALF